MNIFPFHLPHRDGRRLFTVYVSGHKAWLDKKYGRSVLLVQPGRSGYCKLFGWEDVLVEVKSPTTIVFHVDTGEPDTLDIEVCYRGDLALFIQERKQELAEKAYDAEIEQLRAERRRHGINLKYRELFGEEP
jgi:hypothetical protein